MSESFDPSSAKEKLSSKTGKPEKSAFDWAKVMSDEEEGGKLTSFTDNLLKKVEQEKDENWENVYQKLRKSTTDLMLASGFLYNGPLTDLAHRSFPSLRFFEEQFSSEKLMWPFGYYTEHVVRVPLPLRRFLVGAGVLSSVMLSRHMPSIRDPKRVYIESSLDMNSPEAVMVDNIQTMLDVAALPARFVETPEELKNVYQRLLQVCPNDEIPTGEKKVNLNPWKYTYLELFALAPFGFWASVRHRQPEMCEGLPIVRPDDAERPVEPMFVYTITRVKPSPNVDDSHTRHGGCPALHPKVRELDLINRLGKIFLRAQEEFLKHEPS